MRILQLEEYSRNKTHAIDDIYRFLDLGKSFSHIVILSLSYKKALPLKCYCAYCGESFTVSLV